MSFQAISQRSTHRVDEVNSAQLIPESARITSIGAARSSATRLGRRLGHLELRRGAWDSRQPVSSASVPVEASWWLNTGRKLAPSAPESSIFALGGGQNAIWIYDMRAMVMVVRWLQREHFDGVIGRVVESVR